MKLLSWNVNGFRAVLKKGFMGFLDKQKPDILCIQETKMQDGALEKEGYLEYWNSAEKKGYAGTAVFSRIRPKDVRYDGNPEGRVICLYFDSFTLVNVYTPNSGRGLVRLDYRKGWDRWFLGYLKGLEKKNPVVVCGDFNVAHKEIDLARPKDNVKNAGFTPEERAGFDEYIEAGLIDSFREFNKEPGNYTWWTYMFNARAKNVGWRIDYFLVPRKLKDKLEDAFILPQVMGSDHCPVGIILQ